MRLRVVLLLAAAITITVGVAICVVAGSALAIRLRMLPATFDDHHPAAAFFAAGVARRAHPAKPWPVPAPVSPVPVYLAADEHGELRAFYQRGPGSGCAFPYQAAERKFIDPCSGAHYSLGGDCVDGPCVRGLDRFAIERRIDGRLVGRIDRFTQWPFRGEE